MKQTVNRFTWKIGGAAGDGIMVTGAMLAKYATRAGLWSVDYSEYPSLIRGGHNVQVVQVDEEQIFTHDQGNEMLVALNEETVRLHAAELTSGGVIIHDPDRLVINAAMLGDRQDIRLVPVPLVKLSLREGGKDLMRNTVALGATLALLDAPLQLVDDIFHDTFIEKGQAVVELNQRICRAGYDFVRDLQGETFPWRIVPKSNVVRSVIDGNSAIALGFLHGGLKLYSAYPMTPASSILMTLAELAKPFNIVAKHAEDEIAAVNNTIGAWHAGVRAACGTSGGGFSLMVEGLGLAAISETPLVIVNAMRPGPATGLPTWTEQGDLRFIMHASQGEFPRIVVAPGDPTQAFTEAARSLNLAEHYHLPVIILTDKYLAEGHWSTPLFDARAVVPERGGFAAPHEHQGKEWYGRYADTPSGVTPRPVPGQDGGVFIANSDEHDQYGFADESSANRIVQVDKRNRKLQSAIAALPPRVVRWGDADADVTLVTWGSTTLVCREALKKLAAMGIRANTLQILYILPFPEADVRAALQEAKRTILVENNVTGQLGSVIAETTGLHCTHQFLKYDGRPFWVEELVDFTRSHT